MCPFQVRNVLADDAVAGSVEVVPVTEVDRSGAGSLLLGECSALLLKLVSVLVNLVNLHSDMEPGQAWRDLGCQYLADLAGTV